VKEGRFATTGLEEEDAAGTTGATATGVGAGLAGLLVGGAVDVSTGPLVGPDVMNDDESPEVEELIFCVASIAASPILPPLPLRVGGMGTPFVERLLGVSTSLIV